MFVLSFSFLLVEMIDENDSLNNRSYEIYFSSYSINYSRKLVRLENCKEKDKQKMQGKFLTHILVWVYKHIEFWRTIGFEELTATRSFPS